MSWSPVFRYRGDAKVKGAGRLLRALKILVGLLLVVPLTSVFLLTVGHDEAWLVASIGNLVEQGEYAAGVFLGPLTTGGVYSIGQSLIAWLFPPRIWYARLFSYVCWILLFHEFLRYARSLFRDENAVLVAASAFLAVPGGLTLTAQAYGFVPATLMVVYGLAAWNRGVNSRPRFLLLSGVLWGLAVATRANFLVLFPALVMWVGLDRERFRAQWKSALAVLVVAGVVLLASLWVLSLFTPDQTQLVAETIRDTGLQVVMIDHIPYVRMFRMWEVFGGFFSFALAVTASAVPVALRGRYGGKSSEWGLLLLVSWITIAAWILVAQVPHLRYIWPALLYFFCFLGLALGHTFLIATNRHIVWLQNVVVLVAVALVLTSAGSALRQVAHGNSDILSWEWSRQTKLQPFRRFAHVQDQRAFADYLVRTTHQDEPVAVLGSSVTLHYLTGLDFVGPAEWNNGAYDPENLPKKVVLGPMVGAFAYPSAEDYSDLWHNTDMVFESGSYILLEMTPGGDIDYQGLFSRFSREYPRHIGH